MNGMKILHLKRKEDSSVTKYQTFNLISERWFPKTKEKDGTGNSDGLQH